MTPSLTAEIAAAVELAKAATAGPWSLDLHTGDIEATDRRIAATQNGGIFDVNTAALIAACHDHVELIVKLAERVRELEIALVNSQMDYNKLHWEYSQP